LTSNSHGSLLRKKSLARREQDPDYGWLTVNTLDLKVDSKLSKYDCVFYPIRNEEDEANQSF